MLLHVVLFTFKSPFNWTAVEALDAEQATKEHPLHISKIRGWLCARNIAQRSIAADFIVMGMFDNQEDIDTYLAHPDHQVGVKKWQAIADWNVLDMDINSDTTDISHLLLMIKQVQP